jgi:hypothetical protein
MRHASALSVALFSLLSSLLFSAAATAKDYSVSTGCPSVRLPGSMAGFVATVSDPVADGSGLVTGRYAGVKASHEGGVCAGRVYKTTKAGLKIWRVTSSPTLAAAMGGWWSATKSDDEFNTRKKWRTENAVCRGWNRNADYIFSCTVPKDLLILVGPSQSADCDALTNGQAGSARSTEKYPTADAQQLYISRPDLAKLHCSKPQKIKRWTDVTPKG